MKQRLLDIAMRIATSAAEGFSGCSGVVFALWFWRFEPTWQLAALAAVLGFLSFVVVSALNAIRGHT